LASKDLVLRDATGEQGRKTNQVAKSGGGERPIELSKGIHGKIEGGTELFTSEGGGKLGKKTVFHESAMSENVHEGGGVPDLKEGGGFPRKKKWEDPGLGTIIKIHGGEEGTKKAIAWHGEKGKGMSRGTEGMNKDYVESSRGIAT